jgi:hypothetical protein
MQRLLRRKETRHMSKVYRHVALRAGEVQDARALDDQLQAYTLMALGMSDDETDDEDDKDDVIMLALIADAMLEDILYTEKPAKIYRVKPEKVLDDFTEEVRHGGP